MVHRGNNNSRHDPGIHPVSFTFSFGDDIIIFNCIRSEKEEPANSGLFLCIFNGKNLLMRRLWDGNEQ